MATTIFRGVQAETGHAKRQDLRGFATTASPTSTDPIAMGQVACDAVGAALSVRAVEAPVFTTADETATGKSALPALASRRWFLLENQSDDFDIWWVFGSSVVAGVGFRLRPGGRVSFGGDLPNEALRVICATGESATVVAQQC